MAWVNSSPWCTRLCIHPTSPASRFPRTEEICSFHDLPTKPFSSDGGSYRRRFPPPPFLNRSPWERFYSATLPHQRCGNEGFCKRRNGCVPAFQDVGSASSPFVVSDGNGDDHLNSEDGSTHLVENSWDFLRSELRKMQSEEKTQSGFNVLIASGDVMGDIHASNLLKSIQNKFKEVGIQCRFSAIGGKRTQQAGATLIGDSSEISSLGLFEALPLVPKAFKLVQNVKHALEKNPPHLAILLDYPGVNVSLGKYVKKQYPNCKIFYFIPPNEYMLTDIRTKDIVQMSDLIISVYQQEGNYYSRAGGKVLQTSHPLLELVEASPNRQQARKILNVDENAIVVSLFPCTRRQETHLVWPIIADACRIILQSEYAEKLSDRLVFFLSVPNPEYIPIMEEQLQKQELKGRIRLWKESSLTLMAGSDMAIAKSGSCNLELSLFEVPQVVVYKVGNISAWLAKYVFRFRHEYVSLPNLILESKAVPEFIQDEADSKRIAQGALELMPGGHTCASENRLRILESYKQLKARVSCYSPAYDSVALKAIQEFYHWSQREFSESS